MKKIIRKILTTACALVLCLLCLTGCSWLKIDNEKYYNEIVVTVGDKSFTKKELIEAFNNYGYQYYESYGLSLEESVDTTITSMIDRYLLSEEVKKVITLSETELLEIRKSALDYMEDSVKSYEEAIIEEWDLVVEEVEEEAEEEIRTAEESYTSKVIYNRETGEVARVEEDKEVIDITGITKDSHFSKDYIFVTNAKVTDEAWTRYIKALQDGAKSEGRSTSEKDVLEFEENRLIELLTNNKYLEKYEESYFDRTPVNTEAVIDYYVEQYMSQYEKFTSNKQDYHTAMENASSEYVYYHVNSGAEYINVKHILINFTESQKDKITKLNKRYGISDVYSIESIKDDNKKAEYNAQLDAIVGETTTTFDNQKLVELVGKDFEFDKLDASKEVDTYSKADVEKIVELFVKGDPQTRSERFDDLIYIFNDDPGIMNSEFDYVVNLDTSVTDKMVKSFAKGARWLAKNAEQGAYRTEVTEYGIHIIFHDGLVKNIVDVNNIEQLANKNNGEMETIKEGLLYKLCTTTTTPDSNKTIFDLIYDKLSLDEGGYDSMTQEVVKNARNNLKQNDIKITLYVDRYKDLYE